MGWPMAYVIAEPSIGTRDTACVDACPGDSIHPKKSTSYNDGCPGFDEVKECVRWMTYAEMNASYAQGRRFTSDKFVKHAAK